MALLDRRQLAAGPSRSANGPAPTDENGDDLPSSPMNEDGDQFFVSCSDVASVVSLFFMPSFNGHSVLLFGLD